MNAFAEAPGWHGKLPTLGDFASRRLEPAFVEAWDGWLAAGMLALREAEPGSWLDAYLESPSWRFVLMPGVPGAAVTAQCWAGVLMPSVDRVGRYFPFTIVQPLGPGPGTSAQMRMLWHWLGRLDELAGDALQEDWDVERLEAELARMAPPWRGGAGSEQPAGVELPAAPVADGQLLELPLAAGADAGEALGAEAQRCWSAHAGGLAYWYAQPEAKPARLYRSRGLPGAASLARLLGATI